MGSKMALELKLRKTFGKVSKLYDNVRPEYPNEVIEKIIKIAQLKPESKILEVGCGSGKATLPFAKEGYEINALDISNELISIAKEKTSDFPRTKYIISAFEQAHLPENYFDLVISATAFHWVDPKIGFKKAGKVLKSGGTLALFWNFHNHEELDFIPGIKEFYKKYYPSNYSPKKDRQKDEQYIKNTEKTKMFTKVKKIIFRRHLLKYSKEKYINLMKTWAWPKSLPKKMREKMFEKIKEILRKEKEPLKIPYTTILIVARKKK